MLYRDRVFRFGHVVIESMFLMGAFRMIRWVREESWMDNMKGLIFVRDELLILRNDMVMGRAGRKVMYLALMMFSVLSFLNVGMSVR